MERRLALERVEAAEAAYLEALRDRDDAEQACIEAARALEATYNAEPAVELTPAREALRAHAIATVEQRDRDGYIHAIEGLLVSANLRPESHDLRLLNVRYLRAFAPSDVCRVIQEVRRETSRKRWKHSMAEVNALLERQLFRKEIDDDEDGGEGDESMRIPLARKRVRQEATSDGGTTAASLPLRRSARLGSNGRTGQNNVDDADKGPDSDSSDIEWCGEKAIPAGAEDEFEGKPEEKIRTTVISPRDNVFKMCLNGQSLTVVASWKSLRGVEDVVDALL
jgi:hypothetical protein